MLSTKRRTQGISFRVTAEEHEAWLQFAKTAGVSVSNLVRQSVQQKINQKEQITVEAQMQHLKYHVDALERAITVLLKNNV